MRVKLSYTVDEEDVLLEAAKLLQLAGDDMGQIVSLYNEVQKELKGGDKSETIPNTSRALQMIAEFRKALLNVDTRLDEVVGIIEGYEGHMVEQREDSSTSALIDMRESPDDDNLGTD